MVSQPAWSTDVVSKALQSFSALRSYSVTLVSTNRGTREVIRYYYKKPGFVRMEFVSPHAGAVLVYDPGTRKVRLKPFASLPVVLTTDPDSWLVTSSAGHTVDKSDIGALLRNVERLAENGTVEVKGTEPVGGRVALRVNVIGVGVAAVEGTHRYVLWLDESSYMPLKVLAYTNASALSEDVLMEDLKLDPDFPEGFFDL